MYHKLFELHLGEKTHYNLELGRYIHTLVKAIAVSPTDVFFYSFLFQDRIALAHSLASIMDSSANLSHSTSVSFVSTTTDTTTTLGLSWLLSF